MGTCETNASKPAVTTTTMQLVQLADSYPVEVLQCKVVVIRKITYCGMHSHASEVRHGQGNYIQLIGKGACKEMHRFGTFRAQSDIIFQGLTTGQSHSRYAALAGYVNHEGLCHAAAYSD